MNNQQMNRVAKMLKAVANEKRLKILQYICDKEMSVGEIEKRVGLSQSALSQHLAVLRGGNIVKTRRKAQTIFYIVNDERIKKMLDLLNNLFG